jgi:ribose 5-phosphate isomerase
MVLGLGSGTTMRHPLAALAEHARQGWGVRGVPTAKRTVALARWSSAMLVLRRLPV